MDASNYNSPGIEEIYERYADMLFRIAYASLLSKEDAEDAVQEAYAKYMENRPAFREKEHEKAWFVKVTINKCRDIKRRRSIRAYTPLEEIAEIPSWDPETTGALEEVLALPQKYKTAIILFYFEEFSVNDISQALGLTKSAVKMRLARGREFLKDKLSRKEYENV